MDTRCKEKTPVKFLPSIIPVSLCALMLSVTLSPSDYKPSKTITMFVQCYHMKTSVWMGTLKNFCKTKSSGPQTEVASKCEHRGWWRDRVLQQILPCITCVHT